MVYEHRVAYLGERGQVTFLTNVLQALGFQVSRERELQGLSGLTHHADIIGIRNDLKYLLIVKGGIEEAYKVDPKVGLRESIAVRQDRLRCDMLLACYDLKAALEKKGWTCDFLLFQNVVNLVPLGVEPQDLRDWLRHSGLPPDTGAFVSLSMDPIPVIPRAELATNTIFIGSCFLSAQDFALSELRSFSTTSGPDVVQEMKSALTRLRVLQFFTPPTDELLLGVVDRSTMRMTNHDLVRVAEVSKKLRHPLTENAILTDVPYDDPLEVAVALEKHKLIGYEAEIVQITDDGKQISQKITKTPQESLILKVLKAIRIPDIFEALVKGWRGS